MWKHWMAMMATAGSLSAHAGIEINQAQEADLDGIRGIGPGTSARILQARREAPFADWPDLIRRVRGIGPASASRLSAEGVTVGGQPFAGTPGTAAAARRPPADPQSGTR